MKLRSGNSLHSDMSLAENLAAFCHDKGVFQLCREDLIPVADPRVLMDLGTARLNIKQCALLIASLVEAANRRRNGKHRGKDNLMSYSDRSIQNEKRGKHKPCYNDGDGTEVKLIPVQQPFPDIISDSDWLATTAVEAALSNFVDRTQAEMFGESRLPMETLNFWRHPRLAMDLAASFAMPSHTAIHTDVGTHPFASVYAEKILPVHSYIPWRNLAHHFICMTLPSLPTIVELTKMACHFRRLSIPMIDGDKPHILIHQRDFLNSPFWFDPSPSTSRTERGIESITSFDSSTSIKHIYALA